MSEIFVSKYINTQVEKYIKSLGHSITKIENATTVLEPLACHSDMFMCKMGAAPESVVFHGMAAKLSPKYPDDVRYNAVSTGKYFIHNTAFTDRELLRLSKALSQTLINVRQGYTKCSTVVVDEDSIITYDKAIAMPALNAGLNVLLTKPGQVELPGFNEGFLGGCSGRIDDEIIFHGNLSAHSDFKKIVDFIEKRNLKCKWFEDFPLTDIGSIIQGGKV